MSMQNDMHENGSLKPCYSCLIITYLATCQEHYVLLHSFLTFCDGAVLREMLVATS